MKPSPSLLIAQRRDQILPVLSDDEIRRVRAFGKPRRRVDRRIERRPDRRVSVATAVDEEGRGVVDPVRQAPMDVALHAICAKADRERVPESITGQAELAGKREQKGERNVPGVCEQRGVHRPETVIGCGIFRGLRGKGRHRMRLDRGEMPEDETQPRGMAETDGREGRLGRGTAGALIIAILNQGDPGLGSPSDMILGRRLRHEHCHDLFLPGAGAATISRLGASTGRALTIVSGPCSRAVRRKAGAFIFLDRVANRQDLRLPRPRHRRNEVVKLPAPFLQLQVKEGEVDLALSPGGTRSAGAGEMPAAEYERRPDMQHGRGHQAERDEHQDRPHDRRRPVEQERRG